MARIASSALLVSALVFAYACDATPQTDGSAPTDRGLDAGRPPDAGGHPDADPVDQGVNDTGVTDAGEQPPPDGGEEDSGQTTPQYRVAIDTPSSTEIHELGGNMTGSLPVGNLVSQPRWSPSGAQIALSAADSSYYGNETTLWDVAGESLIDTVSGSGADWSADGSYVGAIDELLQCIVEYTVATGSERCLPEPGARGELRWDPSGNQRYAFMASERYTGTSRLYVRDTGNTRFAVENDVFRYAWAPAGDQIAYISETVTYYTSECSLNTAAIGSSSVLTTATLISGASCGGAFAWSPTGTTIAYGDNFGSYTGAAELFVISANTAPLARDAMTPIVQPSYEIQRIEWTPDGYYIGFSTRTFRDMQLNLSTPSGQSSSVLDRPSSSGEFDLRP